jgi:hypothetical protein
VISLLAGKAVELREDMEVFINRCQEEIRQSFRSEEYLNERNRLGKSMQQLQEEEFQ